MQVKIENDRVHQNVLIFLKLASLIKKDGNRQKLQDKTHTAFVNRMNGEIYFQELLPDQDALHEKDWKKVELCCLPDPVDQHLSVEVKEEGSSRSFQWNELTPLAYRVMTETIKTLNQIICSFKETQEFDDVTLSFFTGDLIQATWHDVDRSEAETILEKHPYGSFFFRRDEYASLLGGLLKKELDREIEVYTLTFNEPERKISDITVIKDQDKWLIYNDDPRLSGRPYDSLNGILDELKDRCCIPVFH